MAAISRHPRLLQVVSLTLLLVFNRMAVSLAAPAEKIVSIGFAGPISGLSSASGISMLHAAKMAVDDLNNAGLLLNDKKLTFKLLVQDDKSNPRIAEIAAKYFVRIGVAGVVGIYNSAVAVSSSEIYHKAGIAHFAVSANRAFTQQGYNTAFRLAVHDEQRANVLAAFTIQDLRKRTVAIVHDDSIFGRGYKDKFVTAFTSLGGKIVSIDAVSSSTFDFNDIFVGIGARKAEAIFFGGLGAQTAMFAKSRQRLGINLPLVTAASVVGPIFLDAAGAGAEGTVAIMPGLHYGKSKQINGFEKNYQQRYSVTAGPYAAVVYDQVQVLAAAVIHAGSTNPREVSRTLHVIKYNGLTGPISFDANGDVHNMAFSIYQVKNATWVLVKQHRIGAGG